MNFLPKITKLISFILEVQLGCKLNFMFIICCTIDLKFFKKKEGNAVYINLPNKEYFSTILDNLWRNILFDD